MKLCPYCHNPLSDADVDRLQAENAKLRDEIVELEGTIECLKGLAEVTSAENKRLRELVRCLVKAEHPSDRATLIANAADMLAEYEKDVDYLCDMCANDCDERRVIYVGQGAYDVCERWKEVES